MTHLCRGCPWVQEKKSNALGLGWGCRVAWNMLFIASPVSAQYPDTSHRLVPKSPQPKLPYLRQVDNSPKCPPCDHCLTSQPPDPSSPQQSPELGMLSGRDSVGDSILLGVVSGLETVQLGLGVGDKETNQQDSTSLWVPSQSRARRVLQPIQTLANPEASWDIRVFSQPWSLFQSHFGSLPEIRFWNRGKVALESESPVLTTGSTL